MPSFVTPARLTALAGMATGLAAATTSLAGFFTVGSAVGNSIVAAAGVLGTVATAAKFLEGQAGWEQQAAQHAHDLKMSAVNHYDAKVVVTGAKPVVVPRPNSDLPKAMAAAPPSAELPNETPIDGSADTVVDLLVADDGEPERLHDQAAA